MVRGSEERLNEQTLRVTRKSVISGVVRTLDMPIDEASWNAFLNGSYIQDALHYLSSEEREFIISGMIPEEWDEMMTEDE